MTDPLMKQTKQELVWMVRELEKDRARLDFAEKYRLDIRSNAMTGKVDVSTAEFHPCHRRLFSHKTLRGAIDKAMEDGK